MHIVDQQYDMYQIRLRGSDTEDAQDALTLLAYKKYPHCDDFGSRNLIQEDWERATQDYINHQILTMPEHLEDIF